MKKILSWLLTVASITSIGISLCTPTSAAPMITNSIYNDVNTDAWYIQPLYVLHEKGFMLGDNGSFRPDDTISRCEFVMVLARMNKADLSPYTEDPFDDVSIDSWYGQAVAWAKDTGIVNGMTPTTFEPDIPISREQMCVMLMNFTDFAETKLRLSVGKVFTDEKKISDWAKDAVEKCTKSGIIGGFPEGDFKPQDTASRAQAAKVFFTLVFKYGTSLSGGSGVQESEPPNTSKSHHFSSADDLYKWLLDIPDEERAEIDYRQKNQIGYVLKRTYLTTDEIAHGVFENFRLKMLENKKLYVPSVEGGEIRQGLTLVESDLKRKPWIIYSTSDNVYIKIMIYEKELYNEANENGAAWLMSELEPTGTNVYNFEDKNKELIEQGFTHAAKRTVYEKEYTVGDRTVKAMVIDNSKREDPMPIISVYFVYDSILVRIENHPDVVESLLPKLSFKEIDLDR